MNAVSPSDIRFIFYLPNLHSYLDRVDLISHIADRVGRGVLVTSVADADIPGLGDGNLELIVVPSGRTYPGRTAFAASRVVGNLLDSGDFNIVHDTFGHLSPLFWRRKRHPRQVYLTSYYLLAEWDLRRWIWPKYGVRTLTNTNLRQSVFRTVSQRVIARAVDTLVVQAPGLVDRMAEINKNARSKLTWLPNNVVMPGEPDTVPQATPDPTIQLLWVGGFAMAKGADELLTLLGRSIQRGIPVHATAIGTSSPLDRSIPPFVDHIYLRNRIESEGLTDHISFVSRVDPREMDVHYRSADWLYHVTNIDGSPRVVIEALIRGLPIIGSRHPGVTVLDPDDQYILFADPFDPDLVLDRLEAEKADLVAHYERASAGQAYVGKNFSSDAVSEKYVALYGRLISERMA